MPDIRLPRIPDRVELSLEEEWPRLKAQLEIPDPWLAFVFCSSPEQSAELQSRSRRWADASSIEFRVFEAVEPGGIDRLVAELMRSGQRGIAWVDGVAIGETRRRGAAEAWEKALLRANERRDAILRRHPSGVVFCLPTELKPLVRDAAPDLWSMRAPVIEVDPPVPLVPSTSQPAPPRAANWPDLVVAEPLAPDAITRQADHKLNHARNLLSLGDVPAAIEVLEGMLSDDLPVATKAPALVELATAYESVKDNGQAIDALEQALVAGGLTRGQLDRALVRLERLATLDGRPELAVAAAQVLVAIRRPGDPAIAAVTLDELARRQRDAGQLEQAIGSLYEAASAFRSLVQTRPAYASFQAGSLSFLGQCLNRAGRFEEGVDAAREALAIWRRLAREGKTYRGGLAASLRTEADSLRGLRSPDQALSRVEEAVNIYAQLACERPDSDLLGLARALDSESATLWELGRISDALVAVERAVDLYRQVGRQHLLARALSARSRYLAALGRPGDALTAIEEAIAVYRQLAADGRHLLDLARALIRQAECLSDLARLDDALTAVDESIAVYRQASQDGPGLANALSQRADYLAGLGRLEEALGSIQESIATYRALAAAQPAGFDIYLASALTLYALMLSELGRLEDALSVNDETIALASSATDDQRPASDRVFAMSLRYRAVLLQRLGRAQEALAAIEEAVTAYRQLAPEDPRFGDALDVFAMLLAQTGRDEEAAAARDEADQVARLTSRS
jgi:tetratricopeptide (TPR) repeat protein